MGASLAQGTAIFNARKFPVQPCHTAPNFRLPPAVWKVTVNRRARIGREKILRTAVQSTIHAHVVVA